MISQTAEYALRAVVCLSGRPERPMVTPQIAKATKVPAGYLSKVLQMLGRAGIVRSQRGLHGGFVLEVAPDQLSVLEVINAVDPVKRIERCPLDLEQHGTRLCPLHKRLDRAVAEVVAAFGSCTIQDLISEPAESKPLGLSHARDLPGTGVETP